MYLLPPFLTCICARICHYSLYKYIWLVTMTIVVILLKLLPLVMVERSLNVFDVVVNWKGRLELTVVVLGAGDGQVHREWVGHKPPSGGDACHGASGQVRQWHHAPGRYLRPHGQFPFSWFTQSLSNQLKLRLNFAKTAIICLRSVHEHDYVY